MTKNQEWEQMLSRMGSVDLAIVALHHAGWTISSLVRTTGVARMDITKALADAPLVSDATAARRRARNRRKAERQAARRRGEKEKR